MTRWWQGLTRRERPAAAVGGRRQVATQLADDDSPAACGWFDSSWELGRGLAVVEVSALELAVWQLVSGDEMAAAG